MAENHRAVLISLSSSLWEIVYSRVVLLKAGISLKSYEAQDSLLI